MPEEFEVTARSTDDQAIMGIQHKTLPIYDGLQYHPESSWERQRSSSIQDFIEKSCSEYVTHELAIRNNQKTHH